MLYKAVNLPTHTCKYVVLRYILICSLKTKSSKLFFLLDTNDDQVTIKREQK